MRVLKDLFFDQLVCRFASFERREPNANQFRQIFRLRAPGRKRAMKFARHGTVGRFLSGDPREIVDQILFWNVEVFHGQRLISSRIGR